MVEAPETPILRRVVAIETKIHSLSNQWRIYAGRDIELSEHIKNLLKKGKEIADKEQAAFSHNDLKSVENLNHEFIQIETELERFYNMDVLAIKEAIALKTQELNDVQHAKKEVDYLKGVLNNLRKKYKNDAVWKGIKL